MTDQPSRRRKKHKEDREKQSAEISSLQTEPLVRGTQSRRTPRTRTTVASATTQTTGTSEGKSGPPFAGEELVLWSSEYTEAYYKLVRNVMDGFVDLHSGAIPRYVTQHSGPTVYTQAQQPFEQRMERIETVVTFTLDRREPDLNAHTEQLAALAEAHQENLISRVMGGASEVVAAHDQTINAAGRPIDWDLLLDMLDGIELSFDDDGQMVWPQIAGPTHVHEQVERLRNETPLTESQVQRLQEIYTRQKAAFDAHNRPRRLSG